MKNEFVRKVACNEKLYIASADCGVNIAYRFLIRIDGNISVDLFDIALKKATENCKGVNLKYHKGKWYVSDYLPKFEFVETDVDDIYMYPISWIDYHKHSFKVGGIYHKKTGNRYISFEFIHCVCDGGSAISFIYDVFSALNGKPLTKYVYNITDDDIVRKYGKDNIEKPKIFLGCELKDKEIRIPAKRYNFLSTSYTRGGISAKLVYAVSQQFTGKDVTVMIPVDLRKYISDKDTFYFGNLTLPIFYRCSKKRKDQISAEIKEKLKNRSVLSKYNSRNFYLSFLPMFLVDFVIKSYLGFLKHRKKFILCAIVSYMGEVDKSRLVNDYFEVEDIIVQAEKYPFCTFDTFSIGFGDHLNVGITCENGQISEKIYHDLTETIKASV